MVKAMVEQSSCLGG